jgi:ubiquinone/menaquinone biosynthesis C-methylase UbiE
VIDHYARSGRRWATGASLVYGPLAAALVAGAPHDLAGRVVLDAGAGTGLATAALVAAGARPVAADFSHDMLAWSAGTRPPAVVADVSVLPLRSGAVDDAVAAFVLNHLVAPAGGLSELARVVRPGGAVLACVYSNASRSEARDAVDAAARQLGWVTPDWYTAIKRDATPILGTAESMRRAARAVGLAGIVVDERPVDVGVHRPEQLVDYRLGQAQFAAWLDAIGPRAAGDVRRRLVDAVRPVMQPYRPIVVFLAARVANRSQGPSATVAPST